MNTRDKILRIAFEAFIENGFESISLNQIVKQSDLTKGAFYHYFKSKEELLNEVIESYFIKYIKEMTGSIKIRKGSTKDKLLFIVHAIASRPEYDGESIVDDQEKKMFNLFLSALKKDEGLRLQYINSNKMILSVLLSILEEGIKNKEIKSSVCPTSFASIINTQVKGTLFAWITTGEGQLEENLTRNLLGLYDLIKC
ncbi:TetR/AcrR family transcriptional regulator [Alkaliphilus pronyensis]|uniref:TetR/AcrR family transcriptional regulator n=1 Tax=Alkaliphilus pronyensis TaxID=1482732 RepID=A0A6I0F256_9FIRM|nr:TetR/AcrR family transcriptional regulator [Alkaliphilus pronyensis]KAB3535372.1 TetR/AcrR family transcriptional regulator [Alkaliphilus pronyensis]